MADNKKRGDKKSIQREQRTRTKQRTGQDSGPLVGAPRPVQTDHDRRPMGQQDAEDRKQDRRRIEDLDGEGGRQPQGTRPPKEPNPPDDDEQASEDGPDDPSDHAITGRHLAQHDAQPEK